MAETLKPLFEKLWHGEHSTRSREHHPFAPLGIIEEVSDAVAFYKGFVNLAVVDTDVGCVLLDTGSFIPQAQAKMFEAVRSWNDKRLHTAVYTHGHADHAYGLPPFMREAQDKGVAPPDIIGHELVKARMDRYILTNGYNSIINSRQFSFPTQWPTDPIYPTTEYGSHLDLNVGGRRLELHHARGETDDHTWIFIPDQRVLYTGDLFIWAAPNAGNPQKVQRYVIEWAEALRKMAALKPEVLLPGHGLPIFGEDNVQSALIDTADYLQSIFDQTLEMLNAGATIYDIVHGIEVPQRLLDRPFLQPVYDEPEFIARNLYRCYGGWYTGVPSELKPAAPSEQSREIVKLAGGVEHLLTRATALSDEGNHRMACHLVEWAFQAEPDSREVHAARAAIYRARSEQEASTMSKGIFSAASRESQAKAGSS